MDVGIKFEIRVSLIPTPYIPIPGWNCNRYLCCGRFHQCVDDYPYSQVCPSGLRWDDRRKQCDFPDVAECGPITTSKEPRLQRNATEREQFAFKIGSSRALRSI